MPDESKTTPAATPTTPEVRADATPPAPTTGEPHLNHKEFVDLARDFRALKADSTTRIAKLEADLAAAKKPEKKTDEAPSTKPGEDSPAMARVRDLEIKLALANHGIKDPKMIRVLATAIRAESPQDLDVFLAEYAPTPPAVTPAAAATAATAPSPQAPNNSKAPAPGGAPPALVADTLDTIDIESFRAMPVEKRREMTAKYVAQAGRSNPYRRVGG